MLNCLRVWITPWPLFPHYLGARMSPRADQ
jgi:hypothetical protein